MQLKVTPVQEIAVTAEKHEIIGERLRIVMWEDTTNTPSLGLIGYVDSSNYSLLSAYDGRDWNEAHRIALDNARTHLEAALAEINAEIALRAVAAE